MILQQDPIWKTQDQSRETTEALSELWNLSTGRPHPSEGGTAWETQNSSAFGFTLANPVIRMPTQSR